MFCFYILILSCLHIQIINGQSELKQDASGSAFSLKCPEQSSIASVSSTFSDSGDDHRIYKAKCSKVAASGSTKCKPMPDTNFNQDFSRECDSNEYLSAFESTEFKSQDRKFRFSCCSTDGLSVKSSTCKDLNTRTSAGFSAEGKSNQVITKIVSKYVLSQQNGKYVADRAYVFSFCDTAADSSAKKGGDSSQSNKVSEDSNGDKKKAALSKSPSPQSKPSESKPSPSSSSSNVSPKKSSVSNPNANSNSNSKSNGSPAVLRMRPSATPFSSSQSKGSDNSSPAQPPPENKPAPPPPASKPASQKSQNSGSSSSNSNNNQAANKIAQLNRRLNGGKDGGRSSGSSNGAGSSSSSSSNSGISSNSISGSDPPETTAFRSFDIVCPTGSGIKAITVKRVEDGPKLDAVFQIRCEKLPSYLDTENIEDQVLGYTAQTDGSVQSPCDANIGQFLCGLRGIYEGNRGVEAHCCRVRDALYSTDTLAALVATPNGKTMTAGSGQFIGNLDQVSDGTFVGQLITFGKLYVVKGTNLLTSEGCRCKCNCNCPKNGRRRRSTFLELNGEVERYKRQGEDDKQCSGECECKCAIPNC